MNRGDAGRTVLTTGVGTVVAFAVGEGEGVIYGVAVIRGVGDGVMRGVVVTRGVGEGVGAGVGTGVAVRLTSSGDTKNVCGACSEARAPDSG